MNPSEKDRKLFSEFPPVTTQEWEEKIIKDLKGADYTKKLIWKTTEGFDVKPYYRSEDLGNLEYLNNPPSIPPFIRGEKTNGNDWEIRQDIDTDNPEEANKAALNAISKGATAIGFDAREIHTVADMQTLIAGIDTEKVQLHFTASHKYSETLNLFIEASKENKKTLSKINGSLNFDSLSFRLLYGKYYQSKESNFDEASDIVKTISSELPLFKAITVNAGYFHNAGASAVQELAFALASGNEYLAQLTERGISIDNAAKHMQFVFSIGSNYFMEIAKLRTARLLWSKVVEQYKPSDPSCQAMTILSETSMWNKTVYDPFVNILRTTTEAMSAALGGSNSIMVNPFDSTYKKADDFSSRIARNTQIILKSESYLDKIADPSAGSYYIENLTHSLASAAWALFVSVEEKGGFASVVESGFVKEEIEKICQQRDLEIAMRKQVFIGTNQYPNQNEKMLDKIRPSADLSDLGGLKQYRATQPFEALRIATESYVADGNKVPNVFLLPYGNLAMRKARATFASNFLGCAGYKITDNPGFKSAEEGVAEAVKQEAEIVVICSSDEEYAQIVPEICGLLKAKNSEAIIVVAGNPVELIDQLKKAGVDDFIHVRSNVLATLFKFQKALGII
jgi:methylmalonyl-CoA mutase